LNTSDLVFLLDVDDTLLDNDRFTADLGAHLEQAFGGAERDRYWSLYEQIRRERGYADYLDALQRFRAGLEGHPALLRMSAFLLDYPFVERLYPQALDAVAHLQTLGTVAILSDGDIVFQPRKIQRAGLWDALRGEVLIYPHKELALAQMQERYPASHYVVVDDKPNLLAAMKTTLGTRLTTVFVRQGRYAAAASPDLLPKPDVVIAAIGDLLRRGASDFAAVA